MSLLVAAFGLARRASPGIANWSEGREHLVGALVMLVMAGTCVFTRAPANPHRAAPLP